MKKFQNYCSRYSRDPKLANEFGARSRDHQQFNLLYESMSHESMPRQAMRSIISSATAPRTQSLRAKNIIKMRSKRHLQTRTLFSDAAIRPSELQNLKRATYDKTQYDHRSLMRRPITDQNVSICVRTAALQYDIL